VKKSKIAQNSLPVPCSLFPVPCSLFPVPLPQRQFLTPTYLVTLIILTGVLGRSQNNNHQLNPVNPYILDILILTINATINK